jgi:hypothetical protein
MEALWTIDIARVHDQMIQHHEASQSDAQWKASSQKD